MLDSAECLNLITNGRALSPAAIKVLARIGFTDREVAIRRFQNLVSDADLRREFANVVPAFLYALKEAASADSALLNFERYMHHVSDKSVFLRTLSARNRTVEILVKILGGSRFLTEILMRNPDYLERLTETRRLSEFKHRGEMIEDGREWLISETGFNARFNSLREYQQWELLRIATCDMFGLLDLKSITLQLSLLADAVIALSLETITQELNISADDLAVIAFGKLGGEELNYSSDIDLVFICQTSPDRFWSLGQRLIQELNRVSDHGFLYRVDMRLRPWGQAGPLVTTIDQYLQYLNRDGQLWEKQAFLKARCVTGNFTVGTELIEQVQPLIFGVDSAEAKENVRAMKLAIEQNIHRLGRSDGNVKNGTGGIRDIEFVTQLLQLFHGGAIPEIRSANTLDALIRLAEHHLIQADEYRRLTGGYQILRTIEHVLQLLQNTPEQTLPTNERELDFVARRLDYADGQALIAQLKRHNSSIRDIFNRHTVDDADDSEFSVQNESLTTKPVPQLGTEYESRFSEDTLSLHTELLKELREERPVLVFAEELDDDESIITIVGYDQLGNLSATCGLLFAFGFSITSGHVFTERGMAGFRASPSQPRRKYLNIFRVKKTRPESQQTGFAETWEAFQSELAELLNRIVQQGYAAVRGEFANRVTFAIPNLEQTEVNLSPVEIETEQTSDFDGTVLRITSEDTPGFLYELTNAIAVQQLSIIGMEIHSDNGRVVDVVQVVDRNGNRVESRQQLEQLRVAIILIKHFTHLLPRSPDPESAMTRFQEFLDNLFQEPDWAEKLSPLNNSNVLDALARMLGMSQFLWDDFLRVQHENLFPVLRESAGLDQEKMRSTLELELSPLLEGLPFEQQVDELNAFKDREMLRVDMRHILGRQDQFGMFSRELTAVAEVVVEAASRICEATLRSKHGTPQLDNGSTCPFAVFALGKFGGSELGFASDIELMFIYAGKGYTNGTSPINNSEYFHRFVNLFRKTIRSKRKGIFEIDLRLRPFGQAGSVAFSNALFEDYFSSSGSAWPYERQSLVKMRFVAGDSAFGMELQTLRDALIYNGTTIDISAMRALREKQFRQLTDGDGFNAKLSLGGLVDCEYFVQLLQLAYGDRDVSLRNVNTREAMKALRDHGILSESTRLQLRDCYRFLRRLIDALRMVRGNASDLTVPARDSQEFQFLSRRLGYSAHTNEFADDLEQTIANVVNITKRLDTLDTIPL